MPIKSYPFAEKTVLLTGAGGPAPSGMIKVLRQYGYRIISVDMLKHSPAFYLSDKSYVIPAGNSPEFLPRLREICKIEKVDAVVSVVDEELPKTLELESAGIKVIQPQLSFTNLCLDKFECMNALKNAGINAPDTWLATKVPNYVKFPLFIKPRVGRGSRGIGKVHSHEELKVFLSASSYAPENLLCQPYLPGDEYTVSVVVWRDGEVQAVIPKKIISKIGVTKMAVTEKNKKINDLCFNIQEKFKANGPFNVQLRLDANGEPCPFEINPRFSTSITLTMASGIDELGGLICQSLFGKNSFQFGEWQDGTVLIRHTYDQFMTVQEFEKQPIVKS
jgi:carbamoyl-phosphate synthase large subunit